MLVVTGSTNQPDGHAFFTEARTNWQADRDDARFQHTFASNRYCGTARLTHPDKSVPFFTIQHRSPNRIPYAM